MKKLLVVLACLIALCGCTNAPKEKEEEGLKVGVLQLLTHDALTLHIMALLIISKKQIWN